jgi:hypothetical protein
MEKLYYVAPSDEQFNELKEKAIELWKNEFDELHNEVSRKNWGHIKKNSIKNAEIKNGYWYYKGVRMYDYYLNK